MTTIEDLEKRVSKLETEVLELSLYLKLSPPERIKDVKERSLRVLRPENFLDLDEGGN